MGVFLTEHPFSCLSLVLPKVIGHGWLRQDSYHYTGAIMQQRFNHPNWFQTVTVYHKNSTEVHGTIEYEQVWDGSLVGHRRLRRQVTEAVEALRDAHGLEYILWSPVLVGGVRIPQADRQHITVK